MKLTFLGTATSIGVPIIGCDCKVCNSDDKRDNRLRSSVLIEKDDKTIIIDCGPDFRYQMLRANVKKIDGIILTHEHRDHIAGLDDIRAFNFIMKKNVQVYALKRVLESISIEFPYIFSANRYKGSPEIDIHEIENKIFSVEGVEILPIEVLHHKLPIFGYRIDDLAYITDASSISDTELYKLKNAKVLVINALRREKHFSHFSLDEALEIIKKVKPEKAYLTHISHLLGKYSEVSKILPKNVFLSYDGLTIEIDS